MITLQEFTSEEFQQGYGLYQQTFKLKTDFDKLSERTKQRCRDPLMLRLVSEVNQYKPIPEDAPTFVVFEEYFNKIVGQQLDAIIFLNNMVEEMFNRNSDTLSLLEMHNSGKFRDLDSQDLRTTYVRLKDLGVLLELGEGLLPEVRFTYDRFLEYLLARYLLDRMRREKQETNYLLELARQYRQFLSMWGTLQSMLLLNPQMDWWRVLASSTDYVARSIFVDAMQTYFQENQQEATSIMLKVLDDEVIYSTQTVLRVAREIGWDAIAVFDHAMKSKSEQTRRILVNFLLTVSKEDIDFYFLLYDYYASLMTPFSIAKNMNMAIGGIQNFVRIVSACMNDLNSFQRCNQTLQKTVEQLHLMAFSKHRFIDKTLEIVTMKVLPVLMNLAVRGGFLEPIALHEFEDVERFFNNKEEQQKVLRLFPYLDIQKTGIETEIEHLQYIFDRGPVASKVVILQVLAVQMNNNRIKALDVYKELFEKCNGHGRSWMQMMTFTFFIPTTFPEGYLELLEELTARFVQENREYLFEHQILLQKLIDCPFLSLYFSYYRENVSDMPVIKSLIKEAMMNNDVKLAKRLVATLFPVGIFYPEFILSFVDQHLDLSNKELIEPILIGLGLVSSIYPEMTDSYIEKWQLTVEQKDIVYTHIENERTYKIYEYILTFNMGAQCFFRKSALTPLGFKVFEHFGTSSSPDEAMGKIVGEMLKTLREHNFDMVKIFTPIKETLT